MELIPNKKYILHKGQPSQEVVRFSDHFPTPDEHIHRVFVVTLTGYTKEVSADDLSPIPDTKFKKALRWLGKNWKEVVSSIAIIRAGVNQIKQQR